MTENDKQLLRNLLEIRLSEEAVYSVQSNTSTQKCEAFNRGTLSCLPKEVNFAKNFAGRLASKTLQLNNNVGMAINYKVEAITGEKLSPKPQNYLSYCSKRVVKRKKRQKSQQYKAARRNARAKLEYMYYEARSGKKRHRTRLHQGSTGH